RIFPALVATVAPGVRADCPEAPRWMRNAALVNAPRSMNSLRFIVLRRALASACACPRRLKPPLYDALQACGFHFESFASFFQFELVTNCCARYVGSSITVVTTNQSPASLFVNRMKYSV